MLNLEKSEGKKAVIYGTELSLLVPSMKTIKRFKKESAVDEFSAALELLVSCGVPKKIAEDMSSDHAMQVIEYIIGDTKKK